MSPCYGPLPGVARKSRQRRAPPASAARGRQAGGFSAERTDSAPASGFRWILSIEAPVNLFDPDQVLRGDCTKLACASAEVVRVSSRTCRSKGFSLGEQKCAALGQKRTSLLSLSTRVRSLANLYKDASPRSIWASPGYRRSDSPTWTWLAFHRSWGRLVLAQRGSRTCCRVNGVRIASTHLNYTTFLQPTASVL